MKKLFFSALVVILVVAGSVVTGFASTSATRANKDSQSFNQLYSKVLQKQDLPLQ
ncbi:hypothetical protein [Furfurilactobacillus milii]|uniref:hypothetical protein n=1 Tax=Furfurilactobacillus milii TaxID=2888272 RepID=UPI00136C5B64|nr:hypothetical protein [Furfurilactobacillus milii]